MSANLIDRPPGADAAPPPPSVDPNWFNGEFYSSLAILARTLKNKNEFRAENFRFAENLFDKISPVPARLMQARASHGNPAEPRSERLVDKSLIFYRSVGRHKQPHWMQLRMRTRTFEFRERSLPFFLNLDDDNLKKFKQCLTTFTGDDLKNLLAVGITMSEALRQVPQLAEDLSSRAGLKIVIPGPKGVYLGYAKDSPTAGVRSDIWLSRDKTTGRYVELDPLVETSDSLKIYVSAFVPKKRLTPEQGCLYDVFSKIFDASASEAVLVSNFWKFINPSLARKDPAWLWKQVVTEIVDDRSRPGQGVGFARRIEPSSRELSALTAAAAALTSQLKTLFASAIWEEGVGDKETRAPFVPETPCVHPLASLRR